MSSIGLFITADGERLPLSDGDLRLWPQIELGQDRQRLRQQLIEECDWRQQVVTLFGKAHPQPRLSAWYGERGYRYSGIFHQPRPWTPLLQAIRQRVESVVGYSFNSVLLNHYRDHNDRMGMHSDDERELGAQPVIASLSLGEQRCFVLRHKTRKDLDSVRIPLPCGSLLLMQGDTQRYWRHGIDAERRPGGARINLTFRRVLDSSASTAES